MKTFNVAYDFSGQTVLITGGASGIGASISENFAIAKANIIILDRGERAEAHAAELAAHHGVETLGISADITQTENIPALKSRCLSRFSQVDVLVNNAGIVTLGEAETFPRSEWDAILAVNLSAAFSITQEFVPEMIERRKGKIISIASQAGVIALDKHLAYCVSKAGIIAMTKVMALEWGKYNINVNAVSPTVVLTELGKKAWAGKVGEDMKEKIPRKRFAYPEEIAASILFLASSASDMVHGENLLIDGGYSIQ